MKKSYASMVFVNVMWGLSFVASKLALTNGFSTMTLAFWRYVMAMAVLLPCLIRREGFKKPARSQLLPMLVSGITGITAYYFFEYNGIQRTSTVDASLILAAIPIMTMLVEAVAERRRLRLRQIAGSVISMAGVGLIVSASGSGETSSLAGDLFILGAAVVWVIYIFVSRSLRKTCTSLAMNTWQAGSALITLLPFMLAERCDLTAVAPVGWAGAAVLGLVCSALCYVLYGNALSAMSPLASAIFINLIPLTTMVSGVLFLGERLTWMTVLGGAMIIGSIFLCSDR